MKIRRQKRSMRAGSLARAVLAIIPVIGFFGVSHADDLGAKIQYCTECHGAAGRGYHGYFPIPRLAGQNPEYILNQLRAFAERQREAEIGMDMAKVHGLSPELRRAIAAHLKRLEAPVIDDAPGGSVPSGKKIYEEGLPASNIPACAACHGSDGRGGREIPSLAGQLFPYTIKELANWNRERTGSASTAIMRSVTSNMTKSEIRDVAAYVNSLR